MAPTSITRWSKKVGAGGIGSMRREIPYLKSWRRKREKRGKGRGLIRTRCRRGSRGNSFLGNLYTPLDTYPRTAWSPLPKTPTKFQPPSRLVPGLETLRPKTRKFPQFGQNCSDYKTPESVPFKYTFLHLTEEGHDETIGETRRVHRTGADRTHGCGDSVVLPLIRHDLRQAGKQAPFTMRRAASPSPGRRSFMAAHRHTRPIGMNFRS